MKYVHLEENTNIILGWYDDKIHQEIPTPNIEVEDKVWQEAININANCYKDGNFMVKDFRTQEDIDTQDLQLKKAEAKQYLNDTDWYVTRKIETGVEIPEEITIKRAEARAF